ncbi:cellulose-binding domain-containing protein [Cavenderia fasciculata]|uniref:Cellulose-binding domain-containing protein n=1 Tax=Cavenderia fasciculata TaxID=261658 RepID=F4QDE4_CACFS|nr:cellulose-binding domain-containing protein [Cavenderia fasciculata]EGG13772.1 cellulose-binding domain-containing protein [Cavenderia fasciculata]|eukprot:XP_004350480.1 cellulose-binding domain-containing protein [Cavenderia fasciculata]
MRSIVLACALLLCISFVAADVEHRPKPTMPYPEIQITHHFIGSWRDGSRNNEMFTQYDVVIKNNGNRNIKQIVLGFDSTCRIRDGNAIWNMIVTDDGHSLVLPAIQDINAGASYTFGYILYGNAPANLFVKNIFYN